MIRAAVRTVKKRLLTSGPRFRKVPFGPASGCVMAIDLQHQLLQYFGLYEIELASSFRSVLKKGYRSFDVGGQGGYDALIMAKLTGGPVVSFECEHAAAEEMRETFARNPFSIQTVEAFVSDKVDAQCTTLDHTAAETFVPDVIKIDVEGAEDAVLRGAERIIRERKPHLIIEVHSVEKEKACLEILRTHGYEPRIIDRRKWLKEHRPLEHNRWLVCQGAVTAPTPA